MVSSVPTIKPPKPPHLSEKTLNEMYCGMRTIGNSGRTLNFDSGTVWLRNRYQTLNVWAFISFDANTKQYLIKTLFEPKDSEPITLEESALVWPSDALLAQLALVA